MKSRLVLFAFRALVAAIAMFVSFTTNAAPLAAASPQAEISVGASFLIEPPLADYVRELDPRERREQIRDWAALATVARLGATASQAAAATYELPPARLPYFDELYAFECGRGRRVYLGARVLLFRDGDDPDPQATIGRLADRVRMENGDVPDTVEVYLVDDRNDRGLIRIERAPDIHRAELFSGAYGYVEGEGSDPAALASWLEQVDDLTFAQITGDGRLLLGGRRFARTRTANVTAEDAAALYQAHDQLEQPRAQALARSAALPARVRTAVARVLALDEVGKREGVAGDAAFRVLDKALAELPDDRRAAAIRDVRVVVRTPKAPGVSLDPEWLPDPANAQHPLMLARLRKLAADPCRDIRAIAAQGQGLIKQEPDETRRPWRTWMADYVGDVMTDPQFSATLSEICAQIEAELVPQLEAFASTLEHATPDAWDRELARYYELVQRWRQQPPDSVSWRAGVLTAAALKFHETDTRVQCARDIGLQGTRAGMTLFYTDLLAKLLAIDYGAAAPTVEVPGFVTPPRIDLPPAFLRGMQQNPGTRLWFGPRANGVSRYGSGDGQVFLFEHRFSRIYAAGNSPARPDVEAPPTELARRMLGWWDRHFDDVADYEPEYHRQNQIMKWALVTAALAGSPVARHFGTVVVRRDFRFFDWQQANRANLRFAEVLPAVQSSPAGKECLPLLGSYWFPSLGTMMHISGGVRTITRGETKAVPLTDPKQPLGARKRYVSYLGGAARRAHPEVHASRVRFADAQLAQVRDQDGDIHLGTPRVDYRRPSVRTLSILAGGDTTVGELVLDDQGARTAMRWIDGKVERTRHARP